MFGLGLPLVVALVGASPPEDAPPPSTVAPAPAEAETAPTPEPAPSALAPAPAPDVAAALDTIDAVVVGRRPHESEPERQPEVEPILVDSGSSIDDEHIFITRVVHHAPPPPPEPEPEVEPARGFVSLSVRGTAVNRNPSAFTGARAGFTFDDRFTIGGAFYALTARYGGPIVSSQGDHLGLRMAYGGVLLAWNVYRGRVAHVALESLAGAGSACVSRHTRYHGRWGCIEKVGLVSLEPGIEVGFTITDWLRLGLAGGYRFVTREAWRPPNDFLLSGPYVGLNVDLGYFGRDR